MMQIRNVPDSLHRTLGSRAALEGMSLSDCLRAEVEGVAERLSAHDAAYVALAEALDAPLLTCDRRLTQAPGREAGLEVIA